MRRGAAHKRRDSTEDDIVNALRQAGAFVVYLHGDGAPDLLVYWRNQWLPIEVKSPGGKIRDKQNRYPIVTTPEEAIALFN